MRKENIKKLILYVSLIPYIYVLLMCIYHAIFGYDYGLIGIAPNYGFSAVGDVINVYWFEVFTDFDYKLFFLILCIIYQIYYFISYKKAKSTEKEQATNKFNKISFKKILFIISIICWIIYFLTGIYAFFFGSNTGGGLFYPEIEYGIDAFLHTLFWNLIIFSAIPILPISLIYIIIYIIIKYKNRKQAIN